MSSSCSFSVYELWARPNPFEGPDDFDVAWHYTAPEDVIAEVTVDGVHYPVFPLASSCSPVEKQDLLRVHGPHERHVFVVSLTLDGTLMAMSTFVWNRKRARQPEARNAR